jgi:hypothetical protein
LNKRHVTFSLPCPIKKLLRCLLLKQFFLLLRLLFDICSLRDSLLFDQSLEHSRYIG